MGRKTNNRPSPDTASVASPGPDLSRIALQFAKRCLASRTLDELFLLLVNDLRCLVEFDRAFLISSLSGKTGVEAANNLHSIKTGSKIIDQVNELSESLAQNDKAIFVSRRFLRSDPFGDSIDQKTKDALRKYMITSPRRSLFTLPLIHMGAVRAHLLLEFHDEDHYVQRQLSQLTLIGPILAAAIYEKSLEQKGKGPLESSAATGSKGSPTKQGIRKIMVGALGLSLLFAALLIPFPITVGGEAEVVCRSARMAFANLDGVLEKIHVKEGDHISKGTIVAQLDPTEVNLRIKALESRFGVLSEQMKRLSLESGEDPAKLAERRLLALKREGVSNEIKYLDWKKRKLRIKAPIDGIVITRQVSALQGKRVGSGEAICEIASPEKAQCVIFLPEDRVAGVRPGLSARVYLNDNPTHDRRLVITEISPYTEYHPRVGAVCRTYANFVSLPKELKLGMKGIGKIRLSSSNAFNILYARIRRGLNNLSLYL